MNNNDKKDQRPRRKRMKNKHTTALPAENFNTDDHQQSPSRNVGPGYDDTGGGNDSKASLLDERSSSRKERE
jgi:hypothetical protein